MRNATPRRNATRAGGCASLSLEGHGLSLFLSTRPLALEGHGLSLPRDDATAL